MKVYSESIFKKDELLAWCAGEGIGSLIRIKFEDLESFKKRVVKYATREKIKLTFEVLAKDVVAIKFVGFIF